MTDIIHLKSIQSKVKPVVVIGAGKIGISIIYALIRAGVQEITVYDHGRVSQEDIRSEGAVYKSDDYGRFKIEVLKEKIKQDLNKNIMIIPRPYIDQYLYSPSIIVCVDNCCVRKQVLQQVLKTLNHDIYIDLSTSGTYMFMPCIAEYADRYLAAIKLSEEKGKIAKPVPDHVISDTVQDVISFWNTGNMTNKGI
jgi:predicted ThiF/HesA family dinucleotide-utilizing enzyme